MIFDDDPRTYHPLFALCGILSLSLHHTWVHVLPVAALVIVTPSHPSGILSSLYVDPCATAIKGGRAFAVLGKLHNDGPGFNFVMVERIIPKDSRCRLVFQRVPQLQTSGC